MNVKYGDRQKALHDTMMTPGCLGPHESSIYFNRGAWSTQFIPGATAKTVDLKPRLGETQIMSFAIDSPHPFYDWNSTLYAGKPKGMKQVLWEDGWYVDHMLMPDKAPPNMRLVNVMGNVPDFKNGISALQHVVHSRGHILLLSPIFHPKIAAMGIEYSWGMSKLKFRQEINDEVPKNLRDNIVKSICRETILMLPRVHRFARRTRDFCRSYLVLEKGGAIESKDEIERMRKVSKAYRNIIDTEPEFMAGIHE